MAHADYECCAVCDSKMAFSNNANAKYSICGSCVRILVKSGVDVATTTELLAWLNAKPDLAPLVAAGFQVCYYRNPVDVAAIAAGMPDERRSGNLPNG